MKQKRKRRKEDEETGKEWYNMIKWDWNEFLSSVLLRWWQYFFLFLICLLFFMVQIWPSALYVICCLFHFDVTYPLNMNVICLFDFNILCIVPCCFTFLMALEWKVTRTFFSVLAMCLFVYHFIIYCFFFSSVLIAIIIYSCLWL